MAKTERVEVFLSADKLNARVAEMGREIEALPPTEQPLVLICVLKGSILFFADLVRNLQRPVHLVFGVSSY